MKTRSLIRRSLVALTALVVLSAGTVAATGAGTSSTRTPTAAKGTVKIVKLKHRTVGWRGTVRVVPQVKAGRGVKVRSKRLTVYKAGKRKQANRRAVNLAPGTYRIVVRVKSTHRSKTRTKQRAMRVTVRQGDCATARNVRALKVDPNLSPSVKGTSLRKAQRLMRTAGTSEKIVVAHVLDHAAQLSRLYADDPGVMAQANAELVPIRQLSRKGVKQFEEREFATCSSTARIVGVFARGELVQVKRI